MPEALPAVTLPPLLNAGFRLPSFSTVVPPRGYSSFSNATGVALPLRHLDRHDLVPEAPGRDGASARRWLSAANAS